MAPEAVDMSFVTPGLTAEQRQSNARQVGHVGSLERIALLVSNFWSWKLHTGCRECCVQGMPSPIMCGIHTQSLSRHALFLSVCVSVSTRQISIELGHACPVDGIP